MSERLYELLPALYRLKDAEQGHPLRALLGVLDGQREALEQDLGDLYSAWFIETCPEWVVPYIGDLLGVRPIRAISGAASLRPYVGNIIAARRAKGTAAALEQLAQDVSGWAAAAAEMFRRLGTTQHLSHLRPDNLRTPDLRDTAALERLGGPFETASYTADVRLIGSGRGRYNIPDVAVFLYRLLALPHEDAAATPSTTDGPSRFRFSPLSHDLPLFNPRRTDRGVADRAREGDVPEPLGRRRLYDELQAARKAIRDGARPLLPSFRPPAVFEVVPEGEPPVLPEQVQICDLSEWKTALPAPQTVTAGADVVLSDGSVLQKGDTLTTRVAVDPLLGRFAFIDWTAPAAARCSFFRGFSDELGGGAYPRPESGGPAAAYVVAPTAGENDFAAQLTAWKNDGKPSGAIELRASRTLFAPTVQVPKNTSLVIRAGPGALPILDAHGDWDIVLEQGASLVLEGLWLQGQIDLLTLSKPPQEIDHALTIRHCTVVPGLALLPGGDPLAPGAPAVYYHAGSRGQIDLKIEKSVLGPMDLRPVGTPFAKMLTRLTLQDSIVDSAGGPFALRCNEVSAQRCTLLGTVAVEVLNASDVIATGVTEVDRTQEGCVRYSFFPDGSHLPRRYLCQPQKPGDTRVRPEFTSERFGTPGYAQLSRQCAEEIRLGGSEEGEMGAFHSLRQPQREANAADVVQEFLPFGLEAGLFFVT